MTRRPFHLLLVLGLLATVVLSVPGASAEEAEDAATLAYLREELIREATLALADGQASMAALRAMRRSLEEDIRFARSFQPGDERERALLEAFRQSLLERAVLGGHTDPDDEAAEGDSGQGGALFEAARLFEWLEGRSPSTIRIRRSTQGSEKARSYVFPPPAPAPAPEKPTDPPAAEKPEAGADPKDAPPPAKDDPPGAKQDAGAPSPKPPAPKPPAPKPPAPKPPPVQAPAPSAPSFTPADELDLDAWARDVVRVAEGGTLTPRHFELESADWIDDLLRAEETPPSYRHADVDEIRRRALITAPDPSEVFAYNAPLVALRTAQAEEHNAAMQSDRPQASLVSSGIVREKQRAVETYTELVERHTGRRARIRALLDRMVIDLDAWKTQAALLAGEIEDRKRALEKAGKPPAEDLQVRLAQSREALASKEITLLYTTAMRADLRLGLLESLGRAAREEAASAQQVLARYASALETLRSTRRLDRINGDNRSLRRWVAGLEKRGVEGDTLAAGRLATYRAMLAVNEVVREAVQRRQLITSGGASVTDTSPDVPGNEASDTLSTLLRTPRKASWDTEYIQMAQRALARRDLADEFDATLVAAHFAAANARIAALMRAHRAAEGQADLGRRFDAAAGAAEEALAPLAADRLIVRVRRLPGMLTALREDFKGSMASIAEQRARNDEQMRALVAYRTRLRSQGTRSLLIRIDRSLEDPFVADALQDTRSVFDSASAWATFQGDEHAGGFLRDTWGRVLLVLAALAAAFFLGRLGRRAVDRWIERQIAAFPGVEGLGASVAEERARAREQLAAAVTADVETSADEVLRHGLEEEATDEDGAARGAESDGTAPGDERPDEGGSTTGKVRT